MTETEQIENLKEEVRLLQKRMDVDLNKYAGTKKSLTFWLVIQSIITVPAALIWWGFCSVVWLGVY